MDTAARVQLASFEGQFDRLDVAAVRRAVAEHGLARVRGLFAPDRIRATLTGIVERFDPADDRRHDPRDTGAVRRNFQKLQIGANSGVNSRRTLGRAMRVLYNPIFCDDIHGMRDHFVRLAEFRNRLYDLPPGFAIRGTDDGYWTCSRIMQYPRGGGFMVPHRDMYSQAATVEGGLGYFQLLLLLTEKGRQFREGGAYVDIDDERHFYEDHCQAGDVIVYDGRSMHGVADVDPMDAFDLSRFTGRAVAAVSLFRLLADGAGYARLAERARDWFGAGRES